MLIRENEDGKFLKFTFILKWVKIKKKFSVIKYIHSVRQPLPLVPEHFHHLKAKEDGRFLIHHSSFSQQDHMGTQGGVILLLAQQFKCDVHDVLLKRCTHSLFTHHLSVAINEVAGVECIIVSQIIDTVTTLEPPCRFRVDGIAEVHSHWGIYRQGCGSDHIFVSNSLRGRFEHIWRGISVKI